MTFYEGHKISNTPTYQNHTMLYVRSPVKAR